MGEKRWRNGYRDFVIECGRGRDGRRDGKRG